jgi:hypothetical protein
MGKAKTKSELAMLFAGDLKMSGELEEEIYAYLGFAEPLLNSAIRAAKEGENAGCLPCNDIAVLLEGYKEIVYMILNKADEEQIRRRKAKAA